MELEAKQLMAETFDKNMIDKDEYPQTAEIELRRVIVQNHRTHGGARGVDSGPSSPRVNHNFKYLEG